MIDISFVVCTYNGRELISRCLDSILKQKYPGKTEVLIIDGGSDKETLEIIKSYESKFKNMRLFNNKERLPEGVGRGKWLAWKNAKGKFVAIVDQDNQLQGENWISEMTKPFSEDKEGKIFGAACRTASIKGDSLTNQYVVLQGTDPAVAYKSLDGIINLKKIGEDRGEYTIIEIKKENPIITGGNCFVYKKDYLDRLGGYTQDTENIVKLVNSGINKIAIPKNARTHHFATKGLFDFIKKKKKWAEAYKKPAESNKFSYMPDTKKQRREFLINLFFTLVILPNIFVAFKKLIESRGKEKAWILHPILPWITTFIYFFYAFVRKK
jgi:glycosyltransferase involved in cell wall biosynthesis